MMIHLFCYVILCYKIKINKIKIMKHSIFVYHPTTKNNMNRKTTNIFEQARQSESLPSIHKSLNSSRQQKMYDYVGSVEFKNTKFFKQDPMNNTDGKTKSKQNKPEKDLQLSYQNFNKMANSTINRETILSKLSKTQHLQATKERRNIDRYRQYQDYWQNQADKVKRLLNKKRPSLLSASENVIIEENPTKNDIINNYVVKYWQMSLRNNNPILKRHIKGNKYDQVQLEMKLQVNEGIKQVQSSIPRLPIENLKKVKTRQLSLSGRSKQVSESQSLTERSGYSKSFFNRSKDIQNQEQVYKISYEGDKKWQGVQGFLG